MGGDEVVGGGGRAEWVGWIEQVGGVGGLSGQS